MKRARSAGEQGTTALCWLLPVIMTAAVGCASVPAYKAHPELLQRKSAIRTIGLLAPEIRMYEEQPRFGMNNLDPRDEWSPAAQEAVAGEFSAELAAIGVKVVAVPAGEPDLKDMIELFGAVAFSIQRHAWDRPTQTLPPTEVFREKEKALDYSVGPLRSALEKYQIDALWVVRGSNLLPTQGARVKEGVEVAIGILAAMGGAAAPVPTLKKISLSAALIDKDGDILYYSMVDDQAGWPAEESPGESSPRRGELESARQEDRRSLDKDLRDRRVARHYIKAALAGYRAEAGR